MFDFIKNLFIKDTTSNQNDILVDDDFINTDFSGCAIASKVDEAGHEGSPL